MGGGGGRRILLFVFEGSGDVFWNVWVKNKVGVCGGVIGAFCVLLFCCFLLLCCYFVSFVALSGYFSVLPKRV